MSRQLPSEGAEPAYLLQLAKAFLESEREAFGPTDDSEGDSDDDDVPPELEKLQHLASAATELAQALDGDTRRYLQLDAQLSSTLFTERLLDLPLQLSAAGEIDSALSLARALAFIAPDSLRGDEALILARAGRREEALLLVSSNLEQAKDIPSAEAKAGDVYRALGEMDSAEVYYRRSLEESHTSLERSEALTRLVGLLCEIGRERDASDLLQQEEERLLARRPAPVVRDAPKVGRNDPCPCGSGKKYKKCHGMGD
jgi:tetratricopeptide (TPR) repeat protein